jgi:hypothetical protein
VWWGDTKALQEWKENGVIQSYVSYENQDIKALLFKYKQRYWKKVHLTPVFEVPQFINDLKEIVPTIETWQMKTGVEYFNAFQPLNPYNVYILREPQAVAKSLCQKRPGTDFTIALEAAKWRFDYMNQLQKKYGGIFVNTDNIIKGDFSEVKKAIEYCGLKYSEEETKRAIVR